MKHFRWGDILIFLLIVFFACLSMKVSFLKKGDQVCIITPKNEYQYSLGKDGTYDVQGKIGITTVEIKDNKVRIIDSPCPNKTCVAQNWGSTLICLPNSVIVRVDDTREVFDAIAE